MTGTGIVVEPADHTAFVAAPGAPRFAAVLTHVIEPSLAAAGLGWRRVPLRVPPSPILDEVLDAIRASDALVAFVAPEARNVYIEIGVALGMGKPCVLTALDKAALGMLWDEVPCVLLADLTSRSPDLDAAIAALQARLS